MIARCDECNWYGGVSDVGKWLSVECTDRDLFFFLLSTIFYLFFFTHNTISKIKQNKTADTYSTSQGSIKREGEREGQLEHKSYSFK